MVVRDIIAHFAVAVDDSKLTKMDKSLDRLKAKVQKFATVTAAVMVGAGVAAYKLVTAASDANESLNVLTSTFKENSNEVLAWSKTVADAMGRSEYEMQDAVGKFGAFLTPVFKGSTQDVSLMSEKLSELAVDLASFYNTSDQEATMRLFSGMSGETEAVRRYGIDISDAALDNFNKELGDPRTMRSLTMREKATLRYRKILQDTILAQGDAVKTADEWANQMRRLQSRLKTIAVDMGRALMPAAKKVLAFINKIVDVAANWRKVMLKIISVFNTLLTLTGAYIVAWTIINRQMLMGLAYFVKFAYQQGNWNKKLLEGSVRAAAMMASFLAIEDVYSLLSGQDSILGDAIKELTGNDNPLKVVQRAADHIMTAFMNGFQYVKNSIFLLGKIPQLLKLRAQGKHTQANAIISSTMSSGIVDIAAREAMLEKSQQQGWEAALRMPGQAGLEAAVASRADHEGVRTAELRYLKERGQLVKASLGASDAGKVSVGHTTAGGVAVGSEDIAQGFVPKEYLKDESLKSALTLPQGNVEIGEVQIIVNGKEATDPKAIGSAFKTGVENAYSGRKK